MAQALIRMPDELHRALKLEAVKRGATMQELVQKAVEHILNAPERDTRHARTPSDDLGALSEAERSRVVALLKVLRAKPSQHRDRLLRVIDAALDIAAGPR